MNNIFEADLMKLFNNTNNSYSKTILQDILRTKLNSTAEIIERQVFLKSLIEKKVACNFYAAFDLYEVHNFSKSILHKYELLTKYRLRFYFLIIKNKNLKAILEGNLKLLILFIENMYNHIFSKIDINTLPEILKKDFTNALAFIKKLHTTDGNNNTFINKKVSNEALLQLLRLHIKIDSDKNFEILWQVFFKLEAYISIANNTAINKFVFPEISNQINIEHFYYPVIPNCIPNSLQISRNCVVITGPNMSGKSILLKSISLCVWLANIGLSIPAVNATIPLYNYIGIHLNSNDNVELGYSTFYNEIKQVKALVASLSKANLHSFCLFDEMYASTNIEDAAILLKKTMLKFQQQSNVTAIISTHMNFEGVLSKDFFERTSFIYLDVLIKDNKPLFTYNIKQGISSVKLGLNTFEREGLNSFFDL